MLLLLLSLPLFGSLASGLWGRKLGAKGAWIVSTSLVIASVITAIIVIIEVVLNGTVIEVSTPQWMETGSLLVNWGITVDSLGASMFLPVLVISALVHVYSTEYMLHDPHNQRFFSYLSLFTFMMLVLVSADNLLVMFVGWEGVGICSYLLVSFWFTRVAANQSALAALFVNKVGDCALCIGMFAAAWALGGLNITDISSLSPFLSSNLITFVGICFLIGAMAKSAQFGLHTWLPMAMEGPTPVSALIHAATMVTAGVYLLIRVSPMLEFSSTLLLACTWLGAITALVSSMMGLMQQDVKKIIAFSTMSQLGMMVSSIGLSFYGVALFHLVNHAFYKGLLFLGAGSSIHASGDNQDVRRFGGLKYFLPLTFSVMLIASLSLAAFPFMSGFYSKDLIMEVAYGSYHGSGITAYRLMMIGAVLTTLYSVKVIFTLFLSNPERATNDYRNAHEGHMTMTIPLITLSILSIFFGYCAKEVFSGVSSVSYLDGSIFSHPSKEVWADLESALDVSVKIAPFILTVAATAIALYVWDNTSLALSKLSPAGRGVFGLLNDKFHIELLYNRVVVWSLLRTGGFTRNKVDRGSAELAWLERDILSLSSTSSVVDKGTVTACVLYALVGTALIVLLTW